MSAQHSVLAQIARPYAVALFDLARSARAVAKVEKSLDGIAGLIDQNDEFLRFVKSPVITSEAKSAAVAAIVDKAQTLDLVADFLRLVAKNGRLFALPAMISVFKDLSARARGEVRAEVISATALTPQQRTQLAQTLKAKIGKTVTLEPRVDEKLIGGLIVKVNSQMIDSSLDTKLTAMKIAMKEVG